MNRRDLIKLSGRLIDALGPRLTHEFVEDAPVEAPGDAQQLDLYAVNVHGVLSNFAEACHDNARAARGGSKVSAKAIEAAAKEVVATISAAGRSDFIDATFCARVLIDNIIALHPGDRESTIDHTTIDQLTTLADTGLEQLGMALHNHSTFESFDAYLDTLDAATRLMPRTEQAAILTRALESWSNEKRAKLCEEWLRERSSWSDSAYLVASAWSFGAADELERKKVTTTISVYISENADVPLLLGQMFANAGAIDEARYWLGEGESRFPRNEAIEAELQRWS